VILGALCEACLQRYEVRVGLHEKALLDQLTAESSVKCPKCKGVLTIGLVEKIAGITAGRELKDYIILTGTQFYQAVNGMPLPDEVPKSAEAIEAMLRSHGVVGVKTETVGDRIYLHELTLSNGITVHLAAGGRGAQVLKMTRGA
jgi:hypothetical protein